jgi:hypothetical protein
LWTRRRPAPEASRPAAADSSAAALVRSTPFLLCATVGLPIRRVRPDYADSRGTYGRKRSFSRANSSGFGRRGRCAVERHALAERLGCEEDGDCGE